MKTQKMKVQNVRYSCNSRREPRLQRKIFVAILALSLGSALLMLGCERPATREAGADKRLADLEKQVEMMREQNRDVRAKLRAAHSFGRSALGDFFASPEFWQCTYDSSWSDCSSRCSKQTSEGLTACLKKPEGSERQDCIDKNTERGEACLKNCPVQMSPTDLPDCGGGTRPA